MMPAGPVYAVAADTANNKLYVGGRFEYFFGARKGIFSIDTGSHYFDKSFPQIVGVVYCIIPDGNGGVFIGGGFTRVDKIDRHNLVHIDSNGAILSLSLTFSGTSASSVNRLALQGQNLFVTGAFNKVNGQTRNGIAAIDLATGTLVQDTIPLSGAFDRFFSVGDSLAFVTVTKSGDDSLYLINTNTFTKAANFPGVKIAGILNDLVVSGDTVFIGGSFTAINGVGRSNCAAFSLSGAQMLPWDPSSNGEIYDMEFANNTVFMAGNYTFIGGQSRKNLSSISAQTGGATQLNLNLGVDKVELIQVYDGKLYAFGPNNSATIISDRFRVISLDTWQELPWGLHTYANIESFCLTNGRMIAGGDLVEVGNIATKNLAELDLNTGMAKPVIHGINSQVSALLLDNGTLYCGGRFSQFGDSARRGGAALHVGNGQVSSWAPMPSLFSNEIRAFMKYQDKLLIGGSFSGVRDSLNHSDLALVDTTLGNSLVKFSVYSPGVGGVYTLMKLDTFIYVGGEFTSVMQQNRLNLFQLGFSGLQLTSWQPSPNGIVCAMATDGNDIFVGGKFSTIAGQNRTNIAKVYTSTGATSSWNTTLSDTVYSIYNLNDSVISVGGKFYQGSTNYGLSWFDKDVSNQWYYSYEPTGEVFGEVHFKGFHVCFGDYSNMDIANSPESEIRNLSVFKDCIMPVNPQIVGDTITCEDELVVFSLAHDELNDAEEWSWSISTSPINCVSNGLPGSEVTFKMTNAGNKYIRVRPVGECASEAYCTKLKVEVNEASSSNISVNRCGNDFPYVMNGKSYHAPGTFYDTLVNAVGCDSVIRLTLVMLQTHGTAINRTVCDSMQIGGKWVKQSGIYLDSLKNKWGCDSIVHINLTVNNGESVVSTISECKSYIFGGKTITQSGTYYDTFLTSTGCDSLVQLNLTILPEYLNEFNTTACNEYDFYGQKLTSSGIYTKKFASLNGCDSVIKVSLTIVKLTASVAYSNGSLTANPAAANKYTWLNCQNQYQPVQPPVVTRTYTPSANGIYAVEITNGICVDTSECYQINNVGIEAVMEEMAFTVYPNPCRAENGRVFIEIKGGKVARVWLHNALGEEVNTLNYSPENSSLQVDQLAPGVYSVRVLLEGGHLLSGNLIVLP